MQTTTDTENDESIDQRPPCDCRDCIEDAAVTIKTNAGTERSYCRSDYQELNRDHCLEHEVIHRWDAP